MVGRGWLLTAFVLFNLAAPATLQAQAVESAPSEQAIAVLARLQVELRAVGDEFGTAVAAIHESQAKQVAREDFQSKKAEIFAKHGLTEQEYQQMLFLISTDGDQRAVFDRMVTEAQEGGPSA